MQELPDRGECLGDGFFMKREGTKVTVRIESGDYSELVFSDEEKAKDAIVTGMWLMWAVGVPDTHSSPFNCWWFALERTLMGQRPATMKQVRERAEEQEALNART